MSPEFSRNSLQRAVTPDEAVGERRAGSLAGGAGGGLVDEVHARASDRAGGALMRGAGCTEFGRMRGCRKWESEAGASERRCDRVKYRVPVICVPGITGNSPEFTVIR